MGLGACSPILCTLTFDVQPDEKIAKKTASGRKAISQVTLPLSTMHHEQEWEASATIQLLLSLLEFMIR